MLNRFLELDKDFKKGNLPLTDDRNIFTCILSRSVAQREAEKSSVSLQPSGKVPGTERKPVQVRIGQMWMNIQISFRKRICRIFSTDGTGSLGGFQIQFQNCAMWLKFNVHHLSSSSCAKLLLYLALDVVYPHYHRLNNSH